MNAQIFLWDLRPASGFCQSCVVVAGYSDVAILATGQAEVGGEAW